SSKAVHASPRVLGSSPIFILRSCSSVIMYIFLPTCFGGISLFLMPSRPAARQSAMTRYGLEAPSGLLNSTRVLAPLAAGIRIRGLLFLADQAMLTGAS